MRSSFLIASAYFVIASARVWNDALMSDGALSASPLKYVFRFSALCVDPPVASACPSLEALLAKSRQLFETPVEVPLPEEPDEDESEPDDDEPEPDEELPDEELLPVVVVEVEPVVVVEVEPVVVVDVEPELAPALDFFEPPPHPLAARTTAAATAINVVTRIIEALLRTVAVTLGRAYSSGQVRLCTTRPP